MMVRTSQLRSWLFTLACLGGFCSSAFADPRLVRVIWDVGGGTVYARIEERAMVGHGGFAVPLNRDQAIAALFAPYEDYRHLRKGDRVRLYIVNYNPVAHVWHESSVVEQILPEPSAVRAILSATLAGVGGLVTLPGAGVAPAAAAAAGPCDALQEPLKKLSVAAGDFTTSTSAVLTKAKDSDLAGDARKLAKVPVHSMIWQEFDNVRAWALIRNNPTVYGDDFARKHTAVGDAIKAANSKADEANQALLTFDVAFARLINSNPTANCEPIVKSRDSLRAFMRELTAAESAFGETVALYKSASTMWSGFERRLSTVNWADDAVEVIVRDAVQPEAVLRLDAVFVSPDKTFTVRTQRHLALAVDTHFPYLTVASGLAHNEFAFKKLQLVQESSTASDGTVSAKNKLTMVSDTAWDRLIPVWTQNVRILTYKAVGLYGTFGTTPNRNIFKNVIGGFSAVVPKWRTVFTVGKIWAKGLDQTDLQPVITKFTDSQTGFVIKDTSMANLPLPDPTWKDSRYLSITFSLVSF